MADESPLQDRFGVESKLVKRSTLSRDISRNRARVARSALFLNIILTFQIKYLLSYKWNKNLRNVPFVLVDLFGFWFGRSRWS